MYRKLISNDIRKSRLLTITITVFILLAALLTSLAAMLTINLFTAIDNMMLSAKTPHFLQMHSGDIDMERLSVFAGTQEDVEDFQVVKFLNIEGAEIFIGENSLASSVQDNGLSVQSKGFDFLLDLNGNIITPADGEIYVPIYYMKEGTASVGDRVTIHGMPFTVAGFLRDSQMNAAMISSKRFLISENDFQKMQGFGKLEYLIEFRFTDSSAASAFESAYLQAGLEANGPPAITHALFRMANAISDGMMIAVLILISVLVIIINFLCIRFTMLAKIEEDYREIGVLKAIGLRGWSIKKLYLAKYSVLAGIGCILGFILSLFAKEPLMENIRLYMGEGSSPSLGIALGIIGAGIIFFIVVLYVNSTLRRFKKISAAQAIRFGAPQERSKVVKGFLLSENKLLSPNIFLGMKDVLSRKKLYVTMLLVLVISSFLMIVPQNIHNTVSKRNFMTYMGIGECDMRIDIQQADNIAAKALEITSVIEKDKDITRYTVLTSYMFDMRLEDGSMGKLKVELGDHSVFPIEYSAGTAPRGESEIAISTLIADDTQKGVGDTIVLLIDGQEKLLTVCGIYSDITNGGKTAKAAFETSQDRILWSIIPIELRDRGLTDEKASEYKKQFSYAKVSDIEEYLDQSFGTTIAAIKKASYAAIAAAALLTVLVTLLFMKMLVTKDRYTIAVLKSSGFNNRDICRQYVTRSVLILVVGVLIGTVLANTVGELVGVGLISSFGASTFHFEINPLFAYLFSPALMAVCVYLATRLGISDIFLLKISEHIKE